MVESRVRSISPALVPVSDRPASPIVRGRPVSPSWISCRNAASGVVSSPANRCASSPATMTRGGYPVRKPLAHPDVRRHPPHTEQRAEVPRHHGIPAAADLPVELQQRRCSGGEHCKGRRQAVGKADVTCSDRVGDSVEACAHHAKHVRHRKKSAKGVPGHFPARHLPVLPQPSRLGAKGLRKELADLL